MEAFLGRESIVTRKRRRTVAIVQARTGSTRLPGKVLLPLAGKPMLYHVIARLRQARLLDDVVVATTQRDGDHVIEEFGKSRGVPVYRGSTHDVLARYVGAADMSRADVVVRITADCPLIDPVTVDRAISQLWLVDGALDCVNVGVGGGFPRGLDCEVMTRDALLRIHSLATAPQDREHVTLFMLRQRDQFRVIDLVAPPELSGSHYRLCVDEREDFLLVGTIYERLYRPEAIIDVRDVLSLLAREPQLAAINMNVKQKTTK